MLANSISPTRKNLLATLRQNLDRRSSRGALLVSLMAVLITAIYLTLIAPTELNEGYLKIAVFLAGLILVLQCLYKATGPKPVNWFTIDILYMFPFVISHFQHISYWLMGKITPGDELWIWSHDQTNVSDHVNCATMMSVASLAAFAVGFNLLSDRFAQIDKSMTYSQTLLQKWKIVGFSIVIAAAGTGGLILALLDPQSFEGNYSGSASSSFLINMLYMQTGILMNMGVALFAITVFHLKKGWLTSVFAFTIILVYVGMLIIQGDRGSAVLVLSVIVVAFSEIIRRVSFPFLLAGIFFGIFALGAMGVARNSPQRTLSSFVNTLVREWDNIEWDSGIGDATTCTQTLYAALDYIPEKHGYYLGKIELSGAMGVVPFSRRILVNLGWKPEEFGSAALLTKVILGDFIYGKGTSSVADFYVDFGFVGVVGAMLLLGVFCKYTQQKARSSGSATWAVTYCLLVALMIQLPRRSFMALFARNILWPALFIILLGTLLGLSTRFAFRKRNRQPSLSSSTPLTVPRPTQ